ncbi:MAG: YqeG family HAD IIIA-type phosphatase [Oscillospiraceae bacterium]|nr:YqeG family HAD IIIA-type phosphatase [Oscillospiraceae bacterium]MBQ8011166.1 YqeG family HAD IIIA-type phosphatase [Oscillospiraceae bacterium]MBQ9111458.1 YqeG family HAD IIIA-type phosphatase [Oscillospiraceae bacterium]
MLFRSTKAVRSVCRITPMMLQSMGIRGLLLDIDNTLTTHDNPEPAQGVEAWLASMKAAGIQMRLVSNNHPPRVEPFAERLGVPCICDSQKPLSAGFARAMESMQLPKEQLCVVGDQIFTDILGANWFGVKSIYVPPMELETTAFFKFKRFMEKPFLPKHYETEESK